MDENRILVDNSEEEIIGDFCDPENYFSEEIETRYLSEQDSSIEKAVRYLEKLNIGFDIKHVDDIKDSCTQTSKTILQLANIEKEQINNSLVAASNEDKHSNSIGENNYIPINFKRKHFHLQNTNDVPEDVKQNSDKVLSFPNRTLYETFISKTCSKKFNFKENKKEDELQTNHSVFLEQTSPFKKIISPEQNVNLQNSYIESLHNENERRDHLQISRFTVKCVHESNDECISKAPYEFNQGKEIIRINKEPSIKLKNNSLCSKIKFFNQTKRSNSFMSPTIASEQKSQWNEVKTIKRLISPTRRGRSVSPLSNKVTQSNVPKVSKIPYIDQSTSDTLETPPNSIMKLEGNKLKIIETFSSNEEKTNNKEIVSKYSDESLYYSSHLNDTNSSSSNENILFSILNRVRSSEWSTSLRGIAEITELCKTISRDILYPHMTAVNQRLLQLLRSPRSHVCRTACQAAGHLFESMKDTRRPEFDDIVDILLFKTADANKFIRQDANLALDCMVTHIPIQHAVRALCAKGPYHKNYLVRTATIRLIVCAVVIAGPSTILNPNNHEHTRKRIIIHMKKFLEDKNPETRKYGERLYKILQREQYFEIFLKQYFDKEEIFELRKLVKSQLKKH